MSETGSSTTAARSDPFGSYRAEWLRGAIFDLFTEPAYFPELETPRPCMLVGGRGTGKTTVLRCLSYEGRYALGGERNDEVPRWNYYGLYYRVNTNRVTAFQGPELSHEQWTKVFAHYVNLLLCSQLLQFVQWHRVRFPESPMPPSEDCDRIAVSLRLDPAKDIDTLWVSIERGRVEFEAFLNNIDGNALPPLSLQGQPLDELCASLLSLPQFLDKSFFFIIDEYESLLDYQQVVFNTLIKHATLYTFKIGVRELGWRRHNTLNENEQLISPADYVLIDIGNKLDDAVFSQFAADVCTRRIALLAGDSGSLSIKDLLPSLSMEREADLLGVSAQVSDVRAQFAGDSRASPIVAVMSDLELFFARQWAKNQSEDLRSVILDSRSRPAQWDTRFDNYKYAMLFQIRRGRVGIRKYYCGWNTFVLLASGNIRYLLQLVDEARLLHQKDGFHLDRPIDFDTQTRAAQTTGRKNLTELEGLEVNGAQLTRLLLGLGRIFEVMAADNGGHTPEVNQFHLPDNVALDDEVLAILRSAVMHLALVRSVSNKRMDVDLRAYDYAIHPIYAPFFVFSHRKKRKLKLSSDQIISLVKSPRTTIRSILATQSRNPDAELPEQLQLFESYYGSAA